MGLGKQDRSREEVGEAQTKLGRELTKNTPSKVSSREQLNLRIPSLEVTAPCAHQALEEA